MSLKQRNSQPKSCHLTEKKSKNSSVIPSRSKPSSLMASAVVAALALGGCAVNPSTLSQGDQTLQTTQFSDKQPQEIAVLTTPLSLEEAMARAIKFNLSRRTEQMKQQMAQMEVKSEYRTIASQLNPFAEGHKDKSLPSLESGDEVESGLQTERYRLTAVRMASTWEMMDYGLNYFQAYHRANTEGREAYLQRKNIEALIKETRTRYWKAVTAQEGVQEAELILDIATESIHTARLAEEKANGFPIERLNYQLGMLEIVQQLEQLRAELQLAQNELAHLIHHDPSQPLKLLDTADDERLNPELPLSLEQMEQLATLLRPELQGETVGKSSLKHPMVRESFEKSLAGIHLDFSDSIEDKTLLNNKKWELAAAHLIGDLFRESTLSEEEKSQMLAQTILGQTNIAYREYAAAKQAFENGHRFPEQEEQISLTDGPKLLDHLTTIRRSADELLNRVRRYDDAARLQNAIGRLKASIGFTAFPEHHIQTLPVMELTRMIQDSRSHWLNEVRTLAILADVKSSDGPQSLAAEEKKMPHAETVGKVVISPFVVQTPGKLPEPVGAPWPEERTVSQSMPSDPPKKVEKRIQDDLAKKQAQFDAGVQDLLAKQKEKRLQRIKEVASKDAENLKLKRLAVQKLAEQKQPIKSADKAQKLVFKVIEQQPVIPTDQTPQIEKKAPPADVLPDPLSSSAPLVETAPDEPEQDRASTTDVIASQQPAEVVEVAFKSQVESMAPLDEASLKQIRAAERRQIEDLLLQKDLTALEPWRFAVQVAAIYEEEAANDLVAKLSKKGYSPVVWEAEDSKGRQFKRIWIGLYQDSKRAKNAQKYYRDHENKAAFITNVSWSSPKQTSDDIKSWMGPVASNQ
ncbi:MAG: SPOR domain-containing protein [Magnetococcales bacterium]|nr:SPOR domain-containing protein [Magnetococcales bacterium]